MRSLILIDLPVFPKGTLSLSLPYVSALIEGHFDTRIVDLNFMSEAELVKLCTQSDPIAIGIKVSAQNFSIACHISKLLKSRFPSVIIFWGGELPTLLPEECLLFTDSIVSGLFDSVACEFLNDLKENSLKKIYTGNNEALPAHFPLPDWNKIEDISRYNQFMGIPIETSRGCTEVCTFCMVQTMQKKHYHTKPAEALRQEIESVGSRFINIIDYNFGVSKQHVISICSVIEQSAAVGFMAEMCLEMLDDADVLLALKQARCKMIYCGLESITESSLKAIHKMNTNHIENYNRIISRARQYGIYIASGFILAIDGTTPDTFVQTSCFFQENSIMYAKLTFLTYNPGTKAQSYYRKKGKFKDDITYYDGNHLSFLPAGVNEDEVYRGTEWFINNFYSFRSIIRRAYLLKGGFLQKLTFVLFNHCYAVPYNEWIKHSIFIKPEFFNTLLQKTYRKKLSVSIAERLLLFTWKLQNRMGKKLW